MFNAVALCLLASSATGLTFRRSAPAVPEWACDPAAPESKNPLVLSLGAEVDNQEVEKAENAAITARKEALLRKDKATPEEKAEYDAAREELIAVMGKLNAAKKTYGEAVEAMLQVPSVDGKAVSATMEEKKKDQLLVFYAPWCPHCQTFVLGDKQGVPENAPLELLNKELLESHKDTLKVGRFDTQAHGDSIPKGFDVQYIPTIYLAAADGTKTKFEGAPAAADLKAFIKKHATATKM